MPVQPITWDYVQQLPDDLNRYEAIGGELYVTAAPNVRHQRISIRLLWALKEILVDGGHGELFHAPIGVEFETTLEGVEPDIVFVSNGRAEITREDWLHGPPDLVIEILSPSTASRDRGVKLDLYERQGVAEYWIVDPEIRMIETWRFEAEPRYERHIRRIPVRLGDEALGGIDLRPIFP